MKNGVIGLLPMAVLENLHVGSRGNGLPYASGELNRAVVRVVMVDEAAHESDHNVRSRIRRLGRESGVSWLREAGQGRGQKHPGCEGSSKCERTAQADS